MNHFVSVRIIPHTSYTDSQLRVAKLVISCGPDCMARGAWAAVRLGGGWGGGEGGGRGRMEGEGGSAENTMEDRKNNPHHASEYCDGCEERTITPHPQAPQLLLSQTTTRAGDN